MCIQKDIKYKKKQEEFDFFLVFSNSFLHKNYLLYLNVMIGD